MKRKRLADELLRGLTELRDAIRTRNLSKFKVRTLVACERCRKPVPIGETRGGWCKECNDTV